MRRLRERRHVWIAAVLGMGAPVLAGAQTRNMHGHSPLSAVVHVLASSTSGDTTTMRYAVENRASSGENLWSLLVAAPSPVTAIERPDVRVSAGPGWKTSMRYWRQNVANWTLDADSSDMIHPGHRTPPLSFSAVGLPDTVRYWATPDLVANPPIDEEDPPGIELDMMRSYSDSGMTVGIAPVVDASTSGLLARVRRLVAYACGSAAWISSAGVCESLRQKLVAISRSVASGQSSGARGEAGAFLDELEAQHGAEPGKHVSDEAYWLLRANLQALLGTL